MLGRILHRIGARGRMNNAEAARLERDLRDRFARFTTPHLRGISSEDFRSHIESQIGTVDAEGEGYRKAETDHQRDLSIKFHWGHDHDFGDFALSGRMGDHHIRLVRNFCTFFPISLEDFQDREVLDIGCWTGGTSLMLVALGARVLAVEEVRKYAEIVSFLSKSFGLDDRLAVTPRSLYACNASEFHERFDIVYFPGVLYHLSDPVLALRILFNACRVGGTIMLQTQGIKHRKPYCLFEGSFVYEKGLKEDLSRGGWNWFRPSKPALQRMLREAGFDEIGAYQFDRTIYAFAKKTSRAAICRAGLSVPDIP